MSKIRLTGVVLLTAMVVSCNFLAPNGGRGSSLKLVNKQPSMEELLGTWEVDSFSYALIKENYDLSDKKVIFKLNEDRTFKISNLPDFDFGGFGEPLNGKFEDVSGVWKLEQFGKQNNWNLSIHFNKGKLHPSGLTTNYSLFIKDEKLVIWNYIGDPDLGQRLMYIKK